MAVNGNGVFASSSPKCLRSLIKSRRSSLSSSVLLCDHPERSSLWKRQNARKGGVVAGLMTNPDDFEVGKFIGDYGFMNITSYSSFQPGNFLEAGGLEGVDIRNSQNDIDRLRVQDVREGPVKIRLYDGRVTQGPKKGTRVMFKVVELLSITIYSLVARRRGHANTLPYGMLLGPLHPVPEQALELYLKTQVYPGKWNGGLEAEMMATNELSAHAFLQDVVEDTCQNLQILLGGFETSTGEQWLAFQNDGTYSAADYAKVMSESVSNSHAQREWRLWNPFEWEQTIKRRQIFVIKILWGAISGLAFMHDHDRLHQSLGPASVVLNTIREKDVAYLVPRIRDLAFSVDIGYSSLETGPSLLSDALWHRATAAGTFNSFEKRAFGIADDIFEAGLLLAYLAFVPFCEAGIMDGPSLQKLFESTFQLNIEAAREYCQADERLSEAVKFLDLGDCAGWELLQAMLNPDFRKRPIAAAVLKHRFMTGDVL